MGILAGGLAASLHVLLLPLVVRSLVTCSLIAGAISAMRALRAVGGFSVLRIRSHVGSSKELLLVKGHRGDVPPCGSRNATK
jgi:hypothetical protein